MNENKLGTNIDVKVFCLLVEVPSRIVDLGQMMVVDRLVVVLLFLFWWVWVFVWVELEIEFACTKYKIVKKIWHNLPANGRKMVYKMVDKC